MSATDHYHTLGVSADASHAEVRAAYLRLARAHHPDGLPAEARSRAEARMQAINEAWNVIGTAPRRRAYDAERPGEASRGHGASAGRRGNESFRPFDIGDADDEGDRGRRPDGFDADPTPFAASRTLSRWVSLMPIALLASAIILFGLGVLVDARSVLGLAFVVGAAAAAGFVVIPLLVMSRASKDPHL